MIRNIFQYSSLESNRYNDVQSESPKYDVDSETCV